MKVTSPTAPLDERQRYSINEASAYLRQSRVKGAVDGSPGWILGRETVPDSVGGADGAPSVLDLLDHLREGIVLDAHVRVDIGGADEARLAVKSEELEGGVPGDSGAGRDGPLPGSAERV